MPAIESRLNAEELRSVDSSTFAGSYVVLGTPFEHPIRIFKITNDSTVGITISYNAGGTDHEFLPAGSFLLIDITANQVWQAQFAFPADTQVAVSGAAGTGNVYLSAYYAT